MKTLEMGGASELAGVAVAYCPPQAAA